MVIPAYTFSNQFFSSPSVSEMPLVDTKIIIIIIIIISRNNSYGVIVNLNDNASSFAVI